MKKAGVIILFLAVTMAATAQDMSFGPTIGVNGWSDAANSAKAGLNAGLTFTYSVSPHWAFGLEAKYSMEGGGKTIDNKTANVTEDFIRVPLKLMYFFGERGQRFRPKLYAGPSFGFLVGGKIKATYLGQNFELNSKDYLNSTDVGLLVGTGFNYRLSPGTWLNVDLGYTGGLKNIVDGNSNTTSISSTIIPNTHNHNVALNVGVSFPIGKATTTKKKK